MISGTLSALGTEVKAKYPICANCGERHPGVVTRQQMRSSGI